MIDPDPSRPVRTRQRRRVLVGVPDPTRSRLLARLQRGLGLFATVTGSSLQPVLADLLLESPLNEASQ